MASPPAQVRDILRSTLCFGTVQFYPFLSPSAVDGVCSFPCSQREPKRSDCTPPPCQPKVYVGTLLKIIRSAVIPKWFFLLLSFPPSPCRDMSYHISPSLVRVQYYAYLVRLPKKKNCCASVTASTTCFSFSSPPLDRPPVPLRSMC